MSTPQPPPHTPDDGESRRVRLTDVARRAGVSPTAASFVLTGRREEMRISEAVASRVLQAARETGYRPNIVSRSLRTGRTHTIGFISDTVATTRFAGNLIRGALEAARDRDHLLLIAETEGDPTLERELLEAMIDRQVDGIVLASMYTRKLAVPEVLGSQRVVLLNAIPARPAPLISVVPDELGAGRAAANVLLSAGHRKGIYLVGVGLRGSDRPKPRSALAAVERLHGIETSLASAGVRPAGAVGCEDWEPEFGYETIRKLLDGGSNVKALICFNDRLAIGAYNALNDFGLEIPADVSVVSFDDDPIASWIRPKLTTIAIPHYELGRRSVEALLAAEGPEELERASSAGVVVRVPMPLRERASVQQAT